MAREFTNHAHIIVRCSLKGIVHPKLKIFQDVGDFVSSVEHKLRTVGHCGGSEVKKYINTVQFLAQFELKSCLCSTEETKSPTSWMPCG